ncbi:hypothetical protein [Streptomyces sp. NPDC059786]|uniref:hypothetical protein n=1 Tax=Streptomyces sp. NPDC059786 TaxID=3346946 RepID=UPI003669A71D
MRSHRRTRRLVVGDVTWLWTVRHRHPDCREVLSLRQEGVPVKVRVVFRPGPGRCVSDGWFIPSGSVADDRTTLNLHRPGAVRGLVDLLAVRGLLPVSPGETEVDGWPLLDALGDADGGGLTPR